MGREDGGFESYAMDSESNPKGKGKALSVRRNNLIQAELFRAGSGARRGSQGPVQKPRSKPY